MNKARLVLMLACVMCACACAFGEEPGTTVAESTYFSIYADKGIDAYSILSKLSFDYLIRGGGEGEAGVQQEIVRSLDGLYSEVSDILDIHIYSYHGKILFVADQPALQSLAKTKFGVDFLERSLYWHEQNTIYVSLADTNPGMLGHEIAHAIISHYFIVPPPATIQEVLSGYVEYQLRKAKSF